MLDQIKAYAKAYQIPIICDDGLLFLKEAIQTFQIKRVLEIGSAIGYSAIHMALSGVDIDTIERDEQRYSKAVAFINDMDLSNQVHIIHADALTYELPDKTYDLIFIDAAKAQYLNLFLKYSKYLSQEGIIICDNLSFHHLDPTKVNRNTRQLLGKLEKFKQFLRQNEQFNSTFHDVGDGMSISKRKIL